MLHSNKIMSWITFYKDQAKDDFATEIVQGHFRSMTSQFLQKFDNRNPMHLEISPEIRELTFSLISSS